MKFQMSASKIQLAEPKSNGFLIPIFCHIIGCTIWYKFDGKVQVPAPKVIFQWIEFIEKLSVFRRRFYKQGVLSDHQAKRHGDTS